MVKQAENDAITEKNKKEAEGKIDINVANKKMEEYLVDNFGTFAPKVFTYKYEGVIADNMGGNGPIPSFGYSIPRNPTTYSKYKYSLGLFYIKGTYEVWFSIDNYEFYADAFNLRYPKLEPSDEFKKFIINKCELSDLPIEDIKLNINFQEINFSNLDNSINYKNSIMDNVIIEKVSSITFKNISDINEIKNVLDAVSRKITLLIKNIKNISELELEFCSKDGKEIKKCILKSIGNNTITYEIEKESNNSGDTKEKEIYITNYEGIYNNNIDESNYLLLFKQLFIDDVDINTLPIENECKKYAINIASELKNNNVELIAYLSSFEKRKVVFLIQKGKQIEKKDVSFLLSNENMISNLSISEATIMTDEDGDVKYKKFYDMHNNPGDLMFYALNPKLITNDMVLALTTNFSFEYPNFRETGILDGFRYKVAVVNKKYGWAPIQYGIMLINGKNSQDCYCIAENIIKDSFLDCSKVSFSSTGGRDDDTIRYHNNNFNTNFLSIEDIYKDVNNKSNILHDEGVKTYNHNYNLAYYITNSLRSKHYALRYFMNIRDISEGKYGYIINDDIKEILELSYVGDLFEFRNGRVYQVIKKENGKVLLLDIDLDGKCRIDVQNDANNVKNGLFNYETSKIRKYLNEEYIKVFNDEELNLIIETNIVNNNMGNNTKDKIFILSEEEYMNLENAGYYFEPEIMSKIKMVKQLSANVIRDKSTNSRYFKMVLLLETKGSIKILGKKYFGFVDGEKFNSVFKTRDNNNLPFINIQPAMWVKYK